MPRILTCLGWYFCYCSLQQDYTLQKIFESNLYKLYVKYQYCQKFCKKVFFFFIKLYYYIRQQIDGIGVESANKGVYCVYCIRLNFSGLCLIRRIYIAQTNSKHASLEKILALRLRNNKDLGSKKIRMAEKLQEYKIRFISYLFRRMLVVFLKSIFCVFKCFRTK